MSHENPHNPMPVQRLASNGQAPSSSSTALMMPPNALMQWAGQEQKSYGPPGLNAPPSSQALLRAFRRCWLAAISIALVGALIAVAVVCVLFPGRYTADVLIMVTPPNVNGDLGENSTDLKTYRENQQAILKSSPVLNGALNRPEVSTLPVVQGQVDAVGWLRSQIKVDFNEGPSIMRVSISGSNPEELKTLVNAVALAYVADFLQRERAKAKTELEGLNKIFQDTQFNLQKKEHEMAKKLQEYKMQDPRDMEKEKDLKRKGLESINDAVLKTDQEESGLKGKLKALENQKKILPDQPVPDYALEEYLKDDDFAKKTKEKINFWTNEKELATKKYQEPLASAHVAECQGFINTLDENLKKYRLGHEDKVRQKLLGKIEMEMAETLGKIAGTEEQRKQLKLALKELNADIKKLEAIQMPKEISALDNGIKSDKVALERMNEKLSFIKAKLEIIVSSDVAPAGGASQFILQQADIPQTLDRGRQLKVGGGVGLGVFMLLLLGVTMVEFRSRKITITDDVVQGLGIPVIGTVPALPERVRKPSTQTPSSRDLYWQTMLTEAIDSIRAVLLHATRGDGLQVVMIGSATGGEGKTSLASQLAASLARAWKKTLLIDGDLRNPAAHKLFGQNLEPGFSDVLRGETSAADAIRPTPLSRLWLMPAGTWDSHAVQALAQDGLKTTFDQLKEQYDFIIVDSSPVLPVADALLLAQNVDAVIFSILRDTSRTGSVHAAQQRLERLGVHVLGAVLMGAEVVAGAYPYAMRNGH